MSPASAPNESGKVYPNRTLEDQDVEMQPIVLGPAPFSSPDPETDGIRMLPLEDGTSAASAANEAAKLREDAKDMKAADFKEAVEAAQTQEELDAVQEAYDESGKEYSTVDDAITKRQEELTAAEAEGDGN